MVLTPRLVNFRPYSRVTISAEKRKDIGSDLSWTVSGWGLDCILYRWGGNSKGKLIKIIKINQYTVQWSNASNLVLPK